MECYEKDLRPLLKLFLFLVTCIVFWSILLVFTPTLVKTSHNLTRPKNKLDFVIDSVKNLGGIR